MDAGLEEPIASILWATPRLQADCQELVIISDQLALKYGKEYVQSCRANKLNNVNEKIVHKLSVQAPPRILIDKYLEEIAKSFNVPFIADPNYGDSVTGDLLLGDSSAFWGGGNNSDDKKGGSGGDRGGSSAKFPAAGESAVPFSYPPVQQPFSYPQYQQVSVTVRVQHKFKGSPFILCKQINLCYFNVKSVC